MAKPKEARNKLFIENWKKGLSDESLAEKYNLSIGGVKGLKARLRVKDPSLYNKESSKVVSTSTQMSTSTKRMTFWLEEEMIERIKGLAAQEERTASDILRQVLGEYLKKK